MQKHGSRVRFQCWPAFWRTAGLVALAALLLPSLPLAAQDPSQRTWRLAGIYVGETAAQPGYPLSTRGFFKLLAANAQGGSGDIEVVSNAGTVLFRQRFLWTFPQDISVIQSGEDKRNGVQFAMQGEFATTNGNYAEIFGVGAGPRLVGRYMPPERAAKLSPHGVYVNASPGTRVGVDRAGMPASAMGTFSIAHSNPTTGAEWGAFWFTVFLSNNETGGSQFWEIHYVFTSDRTPAGALAGPAELPPGVTCVPLTGRTPPPPPPPQFDDPLGTAWEEQESGQTATWTRRPGGNTFDARWSSGTRAVLEMTLVGARVTISRRQSSDGNDCDYVGQLAGGQVTGAYTCTRFPTPMPWSAAIRGTTPTPPPVAVRAPLKLYFSPARGDNFTTGTAGGEQSAQDAGYGFERIEGIGFRDPQPGTIPLNLYWNAARGDNFTTASAQGEQAALANGYVFVRVEAYIYPTQEPGTVPLKNYWSQGREDNFSAATASGEEAARNWGYVFAWIEGYVFPQ